MTRYRWPVAKAIRNRAAVLSFVLYFRLTRILAIVSSFIGHGNIEAIIQKVHLIK